MIRFVTAMLMVAMAVPAVAGDPALDKPLPTDGAPPPDPDVIRQGGDTIADAVPLSIPTYGMTGTTTGYTDDYDLPYPYGGGTAPDVVYVIVPDEDMLLDVDLCQSSYDTKVWIWDADMGLPPIAWNDDSYVDDPDCGQYTSKIELASLVGGTEYYIIIDGYSDDHGDYVLDLYASPTCGIDCPAGAAMEGEPPLEPGYVDLFNRGCWVDPENPLIQPLSAQVFCGVSGWFMDGDSIEIDSDWFGVTIPAGGSLEITIAADFRTRLDVIGPPDCETGQFLESVDSGGCTEPSATISGAPGDQFWLMVRPNEYPFWPINTGAYEYPYVLTSNHDPVAAEARTWSSVKGLFRSE